MRNLLKLPLIVLCISVVGGGLPILSVFLAGTFAKLNGCELHEGFVNPCIVLGIDFGGLLYTMGVMGWFMLISIPFGIAGVGISLIWIVIVFIAQIFNN